MPDYSSIFILTGAGISAESGLQTFRAADGLWCGHRVEDVATPEAFDANPYLVHDFYNQRRRQLQEVEPNAAHMALAELAARWDGEFMLVTQNVDDLHDRAMKANSDKLIHMHGELKKSRCVNSGMVFDCDDDMMVADRCLCCNEAGNMRPHIVWFGEMPMEMERIYRFIRNCDLFVSIGTSGVVYPAAGLVQEAKANGAYAIEINLEATGRNAMFDEVRLGKATKLVPELVAEIMKIQNL